MIAVTTVLLDEGSVFGGVGLVELLVEKSHFGRVQVISQH